eukprot:197687-Prorocentrum_minimum.AAC.1
MCEPALRLFEVQLALVPLKRSTVRLGGGRMPSFVPAARPEPLSASFGCQVSSYDRPPPPNPAADPPTDDWRPLLPSP